MGKGRGVRNIGELGRWRAKGKRERLREVLVEIAERGKRREEERE